MDNGANIQIPTSEMSGTKNTAPAPKAPVPKVAKPKRRKAASLDKRKAKSGWIFVLPFIIGLVVIYFPIIFNSFRYSLSSATPSGNGYVFELIGFANYQEALFGAKGMVGESTFLDTLIEGTKRLIIDIPAIVIFSLFIAVILNQKILGRAAFRAIFFIPVICSTGIMGSISAATQGLNNSMSETIETGGGDTFSISADKIEQMFKGMAIGTELATLVVGWVDAVASIIDRSGVQMLIMLAALQSISPAIYESCSIDGATTWETFWKITLPMISPMILVSTIYTLIDSFTSSSNAVMSFIDTIYTGTQETSSEMVISSAMAWMYFGVIILIVAVVFAIMKTFVFYQRRD